MRCTGRTDFIVVVWHSATDSDLPRNRFRFQGNAVSASLLWEDSAMCLRRIFMLLCWYGEADSFFVVYFMEGGLYGVEWFDD
jgi:hypothetical protein